MREFKFRVWNSSKKQWANDDYLFDNCFNAYDKSGNMVGDEEEFSLHIQHYSGLADKNGLEIYEGDILKLTKLGHYAADLIDYSFVNEEEVIVEVVQSESGQFYGRTSASSWFSFDDYDVLEVVGNIFEYHKQS